MVFRCLLRTARAAYDGRIPAEIPKKISIRIIKRELNKNGFVISGVTVSESYDFHQKDVKDQIPREYTLDPVDFRIDIYSDYSDDLYDKFIKEGLKIHQKLNIDNQCNKKNDRLFLHNDKCKYINGDLYTHGGYKCGKDNTWDTSKCVINYK